MDVTKRAAIAEGGGRMTHGTWRAGLRLPDREHGESEGERRQEFAEAAQVHGPNAMRRCAMRSAPPIAATSVAESAAAANKAAQICTVCP